MKHGEEQRSRRNDEAWRGAMKQEEWQSTERSNEARGVVK
jgi:hypothetical protein